LVLTLTMLKNLMVWTLFYVEMYTNVLFLISQMEKKE